MDAALPLGAATGRAAPVDHHHREALVGEPLRREVGRPRLHDPLRRAARRTGRASTGSRSVVGASWGSSSAVASRRSPTWRMDTFGVTSGVATVAGDRAGPPTTDDRRARGRRGDARRTTMVSPPTTAECTPSSARELLEPVVGPPPHRRAGGVVDRVGGEHHPVVADVARRARTWRSSGVTGVPPTTSRRRPSASEHITTRPSASRAGVPGARSTHTSSRSVQSASVAPDRGSAPRTSMRRWSRGCEREQRAVVVPRRLGQVGQVVALPAHLRARAVERAGSTP